MAEANWFWAENDGQNGPVAAAAIARMVADGKLGADHLIWKEGMADWIPIRQVPALAKYLTAAGGSAASPGIGPGASPISSAATSPMQGASQYQSQVGYYNPSGALPPRAAATLQKHAAPRGDVGDWPLDNSHVAQFDEAWKLRKQILSAASLFKLMLLIMAIADVIIVIGGVVAMASSRSGGAAAVGMLVAGSIGVGFTVLYYFAWKGTLRSQAWAPLTMGILFVLGGLLNLGSIALSAASSNTSRSSASSDIGAVLIMGFIVILFAAAFAYVALRAFFAIPKYLLQPAWCQELLSKTGDQ